MTSQGVCVIIAARNAARTIPAAIASALRQPEVAEVVVVDDASTDDTRDVALAADDGSGRLAVIRFDVNRGPSSARNAAIRTSRSPFISILDADDFFLEGRFRRLFASTDWDFAADNIMLIRDDAATDLAKVTAPAFAADPEFLDFERFIDGNISRRRVRRGELGFLKPVISRAFLEQHGLTYDESLRLGEDYELYARAVACGARFKIIKSCGYGAIVRADSLSGRHRTQDLKRLADADLALLQIDSLPESSKAALRRHERHVRDKYRLRNFLDVKAERGLASAAAYAFASQSNLIPIVRGVANDKLDALFRRTGIAARQQIPPMRFLMTATSAANE
ncbi:glycosyltransferase family 2 protein [Mesorhizobium sp. M2D.F.Ca.ET.185.01.1.1]|uniref:glycosyltransferase family 2 protein n=1 Tax=unclassified Mesorhizobium TaxID=325217 RepID=UPI000FCB3B11|nr:MULTISPECIES: glycosyltransferase family 2 protein [unclassified Mesorhizobium]TGP82356.1 glycosyltransferase family 2 protein [bacterium M00.F.Ca.ET.227.01.1.1]TGP92237.1 glycosyltransferase family 2 protein [bacterium M00.F.Ca.ET.221.01.1.1]TGP95451.1 glycosyltransferase family 2 protein [bacterium M00.F.Ca.ET.222.01.1.1]TGU03683.1 glycosyltransferase family 2 protein [bacterium M00.F.Ca.ET.163.01.1.1]TGU39101.1 glycosyltransferase family 2 protein [bacterium M00.F.Ca.ET.156.01.1.1]TGU48